MRTRVDGFGTGRAGDGEASGKCSKGAGDRGDSGGGTSRVLSRGPDGLGATLDVGIVP